jgi:hypothetical protein
MPHYTGYRPDKDVCCDQKLSSTFDLVKWRGNLFLFELLNQSFGIWSKSLYQQWKLICSDLLFWICAQRRAKEMTKQTLIIGDLRGCPIQLICLMKSNISDSQENKDRV